MFQGSMVALVTPMKENGVIDFESLARLVEFHIKNDTDAIVVVGTTGESATLNETEHCELIRHVVSLCNARVPVIAGTGANSTVEAIDLTRCAKQSGADACLLVTPYYNKPTQEGLYLHHKAVAEAVAIPQILYNVPGRTACDMHPSTAARLSKIPNIIGIKEATGDLNRVGQILEECRSGFELYSGDDATALDFILAGGNGCISVTANVVPKEMHDMCAAASLGNVTLAQTINKKIEELHNVLFVEANPIPVKWALHEMGLIPPGIRLPLTVLSDSLHNIVKEALKRANVL